MRRSWWFIMVLLVEGVVLLTSSFQTEKPRFHTQGELRALGGHQRSPILQGEYFLGSIQCKGCHGSDTLHVANVDSAGHDVNLYDSWQSTMMALAAKDPLWRAKVSHEILVNPAHADDLQTKCTSCHAPMGHFSALFHGATHYTLNDLLGDTLGLNGVACGGCHEIGNDTSGLKFSGDVYYDTTKVEFGPFYDPVEGPMQLYVGLTPAYTDRTSKSQFCASCHTLITKVADLGGNYTGTTFVEQATYHEWLNSNFNPDQPCQSCHMPQISDPIILANGYLNLGPRTPFNLHKFMGGNVTMLQLLKANKTALGIDVPDSNFNNTIAATTTLLQTGTLDMVLHKDSVMNDTLYVSVQLTNKAGHKFPSGYPSRRAFVQLAVTSATDTLFQSGKLQSDYEVVGQGQQVVPHYNVINDPNQVQIYEMVLGDVNGDITTVLERSASALKDNRIPPAGFTTSHYTYDTVSIVGAATTDPDFNRNGPNQGTGQDIVHYHIPLHGFTGLLQVSSSVQYQSIAPRWFAEMFTMSSSYIDTFKAMYNAADKTPVLIAHGQLDSVRIDTITGISPTEADGWKIYPVPSNNGIVIIENTAGHPVSHIELWDMAGKKVQEISYTGSSTTYSVKMPDATGVYFVKIISNNNYIVRKVIRQ